MSNTTKERKPRIVNLGTAWPWPAANDPGDWYESTRKHYWYSLEVLPPIMVPGGFFVSEPWMHDGRGVPILALWTCIGSEGEDSDVSRYFVRHVARDGHARALRELREALGGAR